jgi:hypothetical protein
MENRPLPKAGSGHTQHTQRTPPYVRKEKRLVSLSVFNHRFLFRDQVDVIAPYRYADVASAHGFSKNGLDWTWSSTPPYTRWVNHTGVDLAVSYGTMERPFLLTEDLGDGPVPTA